MSFLHSTAGDGFDITPSDTVNFSTTAFAVFVGGAGNVTLVTPKGTVLTYTAIAAGTMLPVKAVRVNATLTTATLLIGIVP